MSALDEFQYENSIRGLVQRIAFELGDAVDGDAYANYDEAWIRARVYDTFKWLQSRRPSLFAEVVEVTLCEGNRQTLPDSCDRLLEVLSVKIQGKSYPVQPTTYEAIRASQAYAKTDSCMLDGFCLFNAASDEYDVRQFWFTPAAPPTGWKVQVSCSSMQKFFDKLDTPIDCEIQKWFNTVIEYVKYVALATERESAQSDQARATFFDLAPVQRRES